jgi:hypothetical protein
LLLLLIVVVVIVIVIGIVGNLLLLCGVMTHCGDEPWLANYGSWLADSEDENLGQTTLDSGQPSESESGSQ